MTAGVMTRGNFAKRMYPGVKAWIQDGYKDYPTEYTEFMKSIKSDRMYEEFVSMGVMGLATIKNEGDSISYDSFGQGFTTRIDPVEYGKGFIITQRLQRDDVYAENLAKKGAAQLVRSLAQTKETLCANVLANGFSAQTANRQNSASDTTLFSTTHTRVDGGTYANKPSTDATLSEAALEQAMIDIGSVKDEGGYPIKIMGKKLIIPIALMFVAERILANKDRPATADRDINALKSMGMLPGGFVVNHYLTSASNYFITTDVNDGDEGLVLVQREAIEVGSDNDFDTGNAKFKAVESYIPSWVDPRAIYGVNA
jgi:phage major head subunit gpT-like protein